MSDDNDIVQTTKTECSDRKGLAGSLRFSGWGKQLWGDDIQDEIQIMKWNQHRQEEEHFKQKKP